MNTRKTTRKALSALLSVALLCGCATSGVAATSPDLDTTVYASPSTTRFVDVPLDYWAYEAIDTLAEGGLMNGYGGDEFGPDDHLSIAQMATIICNATLGGTGDHSGYWAYEAIMKCLGNAWMPYFGEITAEVYSAPCTREVALYMIVRALGSSDPTDINYKLTKEDIPDYASISSEYQSTILKAYQLGLTNGVDEAGTFDPSAELTRAALCTILYRADITEGVKAPDDSVATGMTGRELYDVIATWGWREWVTGDYKQLTATDPLLGGISVGLNSYGFLSIQMPEENYDAFVVDGVSVDKHGTPTSTMNLSYGCNEDGVYVMSSGWSYEARQQVKEILKMAYPTGYEEAYQAMMDVMAQEDMYEVPTSKYPSVLRWIDGRCFDVSLDQASNTAWIYIAPLEDVSIYNSTLFGTDSGARLIYSPANGRYTDIPTMYEFYKG